MKELLLESCFEKFSTCFFAKDEQEDVVVHLLPSKDFVTILPTFFGKSLILNLISTLHNRKEMRNGANVIVLIVLPLKGIMKEQIHVIEMDLRDWDTIHCFVNS